MSGDNVSIEFLGSNAADRVKKMRQLAAEAAVMAAAVFDSDTRAHYLKLNGQWTALADEIEQAANANQYASAVNTQPTRA
jgi:hypothetical protein